MSEQYFEAQPQSAHDIRRLQVQFAGHDFTFETDAGVFYRDGLDEGSALLMQAALPQLRGRVLDLGCGWGPVGIIAAKLKPGIQVTMTDINLRAVELSRRNLELNGVSAQVLVGDGLEAVPGSFDWILLNPPIRAGKQVVYSLFDQSAKKLNPGGRLCVVIRKQQGALSARDYLGTLFMDIELLERRKGYHIYCCRRGEHEL